MIPRLVITNQRTLTTIELGAMLLNVSPEEYLSNLLDDQAAGLLNDVAEVVLRPAGMGAAEYRATLLQGSLQ